MLLAARLRLGTVTGKTSSGCTTRDAGLLKGLRPPYSSLPAFAWVP